MNSDDSDDSLDSSDLRDVIMSDFTNEKQENDVEENRNQINLYHGKLYYWLHILKLFENSLKQTLSFSIDFICILLLKAYYS